MILIACVDNNNGMLFNNRRQSRDRKLTQNIIDLVADQKLWVNNFSKDIFGEEKPTNLIIDDDFINKIKKEDYCFIEDISTKEIENKADKIVIYNWNRNYPADKYFEINLDSWVLESETDFIGNSHEKITQKIYVKGE